MVDLGEVAPEPEDPEVLTLRRSDAQYLAAVVAEDVHNDLQSGRGRRAKNHTGLLIELQRAALGPEGK